MGADPCRWGGGCCSGIAKDLQPNRTSLPAGHTHAFLVDMGSCEESTEVLQATLAGAAGRVRVRFNSLPHGLALGFFHPVEAGDYTLVVHRHFLLPKENRSFR
eukprot:EG_transcript_39865